MSSSRHATVLYPEKVGEYELLVPIASGGMATVYLARRHGVGGFEHHVALKLTHPHLRAQDSFVSELIEEAKLAGRIRHPNVAQVLDVGDDARGVYLVMEYVEGDALSGLIRGATTGGSSIPLGIALRILCDALSGLHAAHELCAADGTLANLVHRDVSPQNILVGVDGGTRLIDFGIAKSVDRAGFTKSGIIKGKFAYMAPEQVRGTALDRRADVWGAGIVAWELLAGRRLHTGEEAETILRTLSEEPPRLRSIRPELPLALDQAIASALKIDPNQRCPTAGELRDRIVRAVLGVEPIAEPAAVARYVTEATRKMLAARQAELAARAAGPPAETDSTLVLEEIATKPARSWGRRRVAIGGAAVFAVAATAVGLTLGVPARMMRAPASRSPPPEATSPHVSGAPRPSDAPVPTGVVAEAPVAAAVTPIVGAGEANDLSIAANAKIARLVIDGVTVTIAPASSGLTVPLPGSSRGAQVRLEAFAVDGRVQRQLVTSGAHSVTLVFGPAQRSPGHRAVASSTGAPSTSAATPRATAPDPRKAKLQENPYSE